MVARRRSGLVVVQGVLLALCAGSAAVFAAWLLGFNGLGLVGGDLPERVAGANAVMSEQVLVQGQAGVATVAAANAQIPSLDGAHEAGDGASEFYGNQARLAFWSPSWSEHAAWVAARALPALGLAALWWLLFRVVHDVQAGAGSDRRTTVRLRLVAGLVVVGVPGVELLRWLVARWLVESSTAARVADVPALHLDLWPFAVGLVIWVIASLWEEAARMREDLAGLV